jgi:hypothetical protein
MAESHQAQSRNNSVKLILILITEYNGCGVHLLLHMIVFALSISKLKDGRAIHLIAHVLFHQLL